MPLNLSQDIKSLFASFDVKNPQYNELLEKERYLLAKKKWRALQFPISVASDVSKLTDLESPQDSHP
ncbi:MAG: hypothetical protein ACK5NC_13530 [Vibrio sp.]